MVTIVLTVEGLVEPVLELSLLYGYAIEEAYIAEQWKSLIT